MRQLTLMSEARLQSQWDQVDMLACAQYNSSGLMEKPIQPGTFNPFRQQARLKIRYERNHENSPHLYYRG
jgi:hypothetical protein